MNRTMHLPVLVAVLLAAGCGGTSRPDAATLLAAPALATAPTATATATTTKARATTRATTKAAASEPVTAPTGLPTGDASAPSAAEPAAPQPCQNHDLKVAQTGGQGTAGSRHADFTVSHPGPGQCTVTGWPFVTPYDTAGHAIKVTRTRTGTAAHVLVGPHRTAGFSVRVSVVACNAEPVAAPQLDVTLTGAATPDRVALTELPACPGGILEVSALTS